MASDLTQLALTTWAALAADVEIDDSDAALQTKGDRIINAVSQALSDVAGREFHRVVGRVERQAGFGTPELTLDHPPIALSPAPVIVLLDQTGTVVDTPATDTWAVDDGTGDDGVIYREGLWNNTSFRFAGIGAHRLPGQEAKRYRITYTSGWITPFQATADGGSLGTRDLPYDLEMAALWAARWHWWQQGQATGRITSASYPHADIDYDSVEDQGDDGGAPSLLPPRARAVAMRYRRTF